MAEAKNAKQPMIVGKAALIMVDQGSAAAPYIAGGRGERRAAYG